GSHTTISAGRAYVIAHVDEELLDLKERHKVGLARVRRPNDLQVRLEFGQLCRKVWQVHTIASFDDGADLVVATRVNSDLAVEGQLLENCDAPILGPFRGAGRL